MALVSEVTMANTVLGMLLQLLLMLLRQHFLPMAASPQQTELYTLT